MPALVRVSAQWNIRLLPARIIDRPDTIWAISGTCPTDRINCADTVCAMCVTYPANSINSADTVCQIHLYRQPVVFLLPQEYQKQE